MDKYRSLPSIQMTRTDALSQLRPVGREEAVEEGLEHRHVAHLRGDVRHLRKYVGCVCWLNVGPISIRPNHAATIPSPHPAPHARLLTMTE